LNWRGSIITIKNRVSRIKKISAYTPALRLGAVAAFLLFLIISAPHRVHHFFEQFPASEESDAAHVVADEHADDHPHDREHKPARGSQQTDCVVLATAQHSHAAAVQPFEVQFVQRFVTYALDSRLTSALKFDPSPCSQRAPPLA
jgi:hypothetical protein